MNRLIALVACLALLVAVSCSKKPAESAAAPAQEPAAADTTAGAPPAETVSSAAPAKVEISDELITKFMAYQKESFAIAKQYAEESRKNLEAAKGDTAKLMNQVAMTDKMGKEMNAKLEATRKSLGLGEAEFEVVQEAAQAIATSRALYNQMGGDAQLAKMEAEQKAQIAQMPADQRAAAEAQMAEMTKSFHEMRDGVEIRKKYGDKSADALLKRADELAKQYWDALKQLGDRK